MSVWAPPLALASHLIPARQLENREKRGRLPTGVAAIDELVGGGWVRGALNEIAGPRGSGRTSLLFGSLAGVLARGEATALVDSGGMLDARAAARAGISLGSMLWIRCEPGQALAATEIVLGAGGFGLLALDLGERPPRPPTAAWQRLRRGAEQQGTALLVVAPRPTSGAWNECSLALHDGRPHFERKGGDASVLLSIETRVTLTRTPSRASLPDGHIVFTRQS